MCSLSPPTFRSLLTFRAQKHLGGHVVGHPRGKLLGGSSAINALFWTHASQADINDWGILGNKGWSWKSLMPYFFKSEAYLAPTPKTAKDLDIVSEIDASLHGKHGPVFDSFPEFYGPVQEAWPRKSLNLLKMLAWPNSPSLLHRINDFTDLDSPLSNMQSS